MIDLKFDQTPKIASTESDNITQAGMLRPIKDQSTFAHSPDPEKTISKTSPRAKFSTIKSRPGPQPGTFSDGRFCNHTCLEATSIPEREVINIKQPIKILEKLLLKGKQPSRNVNPSKIVEIL